MEDKKAFDYLTTLPETIQDEKGRITSGIAQDTNKNGTAGQPCLFCRHKDLILKAVNDYSKKAETGINAKLFIPYIEELVLMFHPLHEDLKTISDTTLINWINKSLDTGEPEHPELIANYTILKMIQRWRLKQRLMGRYNPRGAMYLLSADHNVNETIEQKLKGDKNEPLQIEIIEEKNNNDD